MASHGLPPISSVPTKTTPERLAILDLLFEPCKQLHTLSVGLLSTEKFSSYDDMIEGVGAQLTILAESKSTSDIEWLQEILRAHPRLGEKKVNSAHSRAEQAQLNSGGSSEERALVELNSEYELAFPGLRYVVFVNGRGRDSIMKDMRARISRGDIALERKEAIKAMCDIAVDRASKSNATTT